VPCSGGGYGLNITADDYAAFWSRSNIEPWSKLFGSADVERWSEAQLRDVPLLDASRAHLQLFGLPRNFALVGKEHYGPLLSKLVEGRFYVVGAFDRIYVCIALKDQDRVVAIATDDARHRDFINSSIEQFGRFLGLYEQYRRALTAEDGLKDPMCEPTIQQMYAIDPAAFDGELWWSNIVEEMRFGML
jgi:SUKH-4 immunity protein